MDFNIFAIYACGSVVFLIVLICGELLFAAKYARRQRFALRFVCGNAMVIIFSILFTLLYYYIELTFNSNFIASIRVVVTYIIFFALAITVMYFSYKESLWRCLTAGALGYICQHIAYNIYSIVEVSSNLEYNLIVSIGMGGYAFAVLLQLAIAAMVVFTVWLILGRKINSFSADGIARGNAMFIAISTLAIVLLLSSLGFVFGADNLGVNIVFKCMLIVCCVLMLILYVNIFEVKEAQAERDIVLKLNESEHAHFLKLKQDMELVSVKCHDIKHFIAAAGAKGGVDLAELSEAVKIYDTTIKTGNEVIDTLLAEQSLHCNAHGINLTVIADASPLSFIPVNDMCSLFGNLMENAVEAAEQVPEKDNRLININIRPVAGQVFFCVENSYAEEPVMRGGLPLSTKKSEAGYHGYGIKSVKMIAEKYGGNFTLGAKDGIFRVSILFPLPESEQK